MSTVIIVLIILAIIAFAVYGTMQRMKGKSSCCGSNSVIIEPTKKLDNPVSKKIFHIDGMTCDNCRNHVTRALQRIDGVSCLVNLKKNIATVEMDREISESELTDAIEGGGYKVVSIENC